MDWTRVLEIKQGALSVNDESLNGSVATNICIEHPHIEVPSTI